MGSKIFISRMSIGTFVGLNTNTPVKPNPTPTTTVIPSAITQSSHMRFTLTGEQAQEIAIFMDFIHAYNNGQLDAALALLSENISGSDCNYREIRIFSFQGKSQATRWLLNQFSEHDQLEVSHIYNENPDPDGAHVIGIEYSRRSNATLVELGFSKGITPQLVSKVIFEVAPTLIRSFLFQIL